MKITQDLLNLAFGAEPIRYRPECEAIVKYAREIMGLNLTIHQAQDLWEWHSSYQDAQWLCVREEDIADAIEGFIKKRLQSYLKEIF